jgi:integrase
MPCDRAAAEQGPSRRRRGPKPKPIIEHPEPLSTSWAEPGTFSGSLALHMRRHGDSCWHLCKAVAGPRDHFDRRTLQSWVSGEDAPRTARSMKILARIERRYRLPAGHFKALLPHPGRAAAQSLTGISLAESRRLAWHLPDDFMSRAPADRAEILQWVRANILGGTTEYRRFQAAAMKERFALKFRVRASRRTAEGAQTRCGSLEAPPRLQEEMENLVAFKTAALTCLGFNRNSSWCEETASQRVEHLGLMFGALAAPADGAIAGLGVPVERLTFALLAFPKVWDWYLNWRCRRRGFFTTWEVDMLQLGLSLIRAETGWLRQSPKLARRLSPVHQLVSGDDVAAAQADWSGQCDRFCAYALGRAKEIGRVARVHRDPFEPILPILEAESPLGEYRKITEEIVRRMPDPRRYPRAAAEATRAFLMLRLALHLGVRQRNLRELLLCARGECRRSERELEQLRRGELRWREGLAAWEVLLPSAAFKNARSSFFGNRPLRLLLPDLGGLYEHLDRYVRVQRRMLLKGAADPGTLFVKTVKATSREASYNKNNFYQAWCLAIQRYGIWNPYTERGVIRGLLPHGPHCVRDVLATHVLKHTGSFEKASYAIQDTPEMVAKHYGRFLPQDKAALAAEVLNQSWL